MALLKHTVAALASGTVVLVAALLMTFGAFAHSSAHPTKHGTMSRPRTIHKTKCSARQRHKSKCKQSKLHRRATPVRPSRPHATTAPTTTTPPTTPPSSTGSEYPPTPVDDNPGCPGRSTGPCECSSHAPRETSRVYKAGEIEIIVPKPEAEPCGSTAHVIIRNNSGSTIAQAEVPEGGPAVSFILAEEGSYEAIATDTSCERAINHFTVSTEPSRVWLTMTPSTCTP